MRLLFRAMALAAVAVCAMLTIPIAAFAQDAAVPVEKITGILQPYLVEIVSVLIAAAVAFVARQVTKITGIQIEANHRDALQSALENGARLILDRLDQQVAGKTINVKSAPLADGINYVLASVPDAVTYFGLTPDRIGDLLRPKLIPKA